MSPATLSCFFVPSPCSPFPFNGHAVNYYRHFEMSDFVTEQFYTRCIFFLSPPVSSFFLRVARVFTVRLVRPSRFLFPSNYLFTPFFPSIFYYTLSPPFTPLVFCVKPSLRWSNSIFVAGNLFFHVRAECVIKMYTHFIIVITSRRLSIENSGLLVSADSVECTRTLYRVIQQKLHHLSIK